MNEANTTAPAQAAAENNSVVILTFAEAKQPKFRETRGGAYVKFGDDNLYPLYLLDRFDKSTKHGAIIAGKAVYIAGNGWKTKDGVEDERATVFIKNINRYGESLDEVVRKCALDEEIFGGYYLQIIWGTASKRIAEIYHIEYSRIRSSKDNTQFYYRESWKAGDRFFDWNKEKTFPAFNPANPRGTQIYFYKSYRPGTRTYPLPSYMRGLNFILAEEEVGKHTLGNSQSGFNASLSITYIGGEPKEEDKREITRRYTNAFTGSEGRKFILNFAKTKETAPQFDQLGASDLTKEDYTAVDTLIQNNLYTCHQITTPALFGVATPGQLGQQKELRDGYEIFNKTYVNSKQIQLEQVFNRLARYAGVSAPLQIIPTEPLSISLEEVKDFAPKAYLYERAGIDTSKYPVPAETAPQEQQMTAAQPAINDALKGLTGRQHQQFERILRRYAKGQLNKAQAKILLGSGFGLTDAQIETILGDGTDQTAVVNAMLVSQAYALISEEEPQTWDIDHVISVFAEFGSDASLYTILKTRAVKFSDAAEAEEKEYAYVSFAKGQISELQASILDLISKDKRITPEVMANTLAVDLSEINTALGVLEKSGAIKVVGDVRTLSKPLSELQEGVKAKTKKFRVMYSYDGPQDSKNRPFCAKMMELGRFYTRTEIEKISARLGYSVWDRRGGFYTNPNTGETTPYCRHSWVSHIVMINE
jgi:hypothetical protein